jgi:hypothetical protein
LLTDTAPNTCTKFWEALPLRVNLSTWGDELYDTISVDINAENPREEFEVGDIAYWLQGSGFCILYGRTPASTSNKPRLISPGNHLAKIEGDISIFKGLNGLDLIIERGGENKKTELPLFQGNPAIAKDPWFSVPVLQQVWLCLSF